MTIKNAEKAVKRFDSGYNCAESVLLALSEHFHQESSIIPRIATGFGAGVGRSGQICGALSGAVMAIGLLRGCEKGEEEREKRNAAYESVRQMIKAFEKEFGSSQCRVLTQCDLQAQEGKEKYQHKEFRKELCPKFIGWCADYVIEKYR
ncbi:MAG TPA: C-GCAxxG-C-C family protein [Candidatus Krumholzibacteriaceae bacterium]|nr:C-GCAxxG-C-C family protein [Candidatus Krumholzibacteriaceae bacterium]